MYEVLEVSLADTRRLYEYALKGVSKDVRADMLNRKWFEDAWILDSHSWVKGERVLDVWAGYSPLPARIQRTYGCEVWAVDDYGLGLDSDPFWTRRHDPHAHVAKHPEVKHVLELVGDPSNSSLPTEYFDVIYSVSAIEHVPPSLTPSVWKHMGMLLKPGGEMLHGVDIGFPSNKGVIRLLQTAVFDALPSWVTGRVRRRWPLLSPRGYVKLVFDTLGIKEKIPGEFSVFNVALNPEILTEVAPEI